MIIGRFFEEVFVDEIYKPVRDLGQIDDVIDLGATTGEFSLWVYPQSLRIYAIDADPEAYKHLEENVKDLSRITPFHLAIMGENGEKGISGSRMGGKSMILSQAQDLPLIKTRTLATFLEENGIKEVDCLKVDVEDSENEIFKAEDFPDIAHKIKFIIGEHLELARKDLVKNGFTIESYQFGLIAKR